MRTPFARRRFGSPGTFPREGIPRYYHGPKAEFHSREEMRQRSTKFSVCRRFLETLSPCSLGLIRQFLPPGSRPRGSMRFTIWGCRPVGLPSGRRVRKTFSARDPREVSLACLPSWTSYQRHPPLPGIPGGSLSSSRFLPRLRAPRWTRQRAVSTGRRLGSRRSHLFLRSRPLDGPLAWRPCPGSSIVVARA